MQIPSSSNLANLPYQQAIDHSLRYLNSSAAIRAYQNYPIPEITRQRVQRSLVRFRQFLILIEEYALTLENEQ